MKIQQGGEPLEEIARLGWELAPHLCDKARGCCDYHRVWSIVRLLIGGGELPAGHAELHDAVVTQARRGARRILVSGGADTGTTMIAILAFRAAGVEPEIVFSDVCSTPCALVRRLSELSATRISVIQADVRDLLIEPVDVVLAHTFLTFFQGSERMEVIRTWARCLSAGGSLLMSQPLVDDETEFATPRDPVRVLALKSRLREQAAGIGFEEVVTREICEAAHRFWSGVFQRPPGLTPEVLGGLLVSGGFEVVSLCEVPSHAGRGPRAVASAGSASRKRFLVQALRSSL